MISSKMPSERKTKEKKCTKKAIENGEHTCPQKTRDNAQRNEEKKINRLVVRKLEKYMNKEKREEQFDPLGHFRTSFRMHKYDLMYKVIESTALEKATREKRKKDNKGSTGGSGNGSSPVLVRNSRQITLESEAFRIKQHMATVLEEIPVRELAKLHGFNTKPKHVKHTEGPTQSSTKFLPPIQGYSSHVGSILHGLKYVDYYVGQGLKGGTEEFVRRLKEQKKVRSSYSLSDEGSSWTDQETDSYKSERSIESPRNSHEVKTKEEAEQSIDAYSNEVNDDEEKGDYGADQECVEDGAVVEEKKEEEEEKKDLPLKDEGDKGITDSLATHSDQGCLDTSTSSGHLAGTHSRSPSSSSECSSVGDRKSSARSSRHSDSSWNASEREGNSDEQLVPEVDRCADSELSSKVTIRSGKPVMDPELPVSESTVRAANSHFEEENEDGNYSDDFKVESLKQLDDSAPNTARSRPSSNRSRKSDAASLQTYVSLEHAELPATIE